MALRQMADVPSRIARLRWRIQLDCVAMLAFRARWATMADVGLYLTYDASPQKTMDTSNCAIRVSTRSWGSNAMRVEQRRLPMVVIGSGSFKLVDKTAALLHKLFLEFGPAAASVRRASGSVRQAMSDMGTGFGTANAGYCVDLFVRNTTEAVCGDPCGGAAGVCDEWLFPRAMQTPGVLHLVDGVLMSTLEGMGWWPHLQKDMKLVTQWLSVDGHRDRLVQHLQKVCEARGFCDVSEAVKLLSKKPESFADWRWRTLQRATGVLLRHAPVVNWLVLGGLDNEETKTQSWFGGQRAHMARVVGRASVWDMVYMLNTVLAPNCRSRVGSWVARVTRPSCLRLVLRWIAFGRGVVAPSCLGSWRRWPVMWPNRWSRNRGIANFG